MYKERLISNLLILVLVSALEFVFFHTSGTISSIIAWILFGICIIASGSVIIEIYPPELKKEGKKNFSKNILVYLLLGIITLFINHSFFGVTLLAVSFFIAGVVNCIFGLIYKNKK